jgi:malonyl-CoA/methylmalonyl-CoA synthetase
MVSGSAALPEAQMNQWYDISGQRLLERFGMTETGFPLSNLYHPIKLRTPGHVGRPVLGARVALLDLDDDQTIYLDD